MTKTYQNGVWNAFRFDRECHNINQSLKTFKIYGLSESALQTVGFIRNYTGAVDKSENKINGKTKKFAVINLNKPLKIIKISLKRCMKQKKKRSHLGL